MYVCDRGTFDPSVFDWEGRRLVQALRQATTSKLDVFPGPS